MGARRLQPKGNYPGPVWCSMPTDYPTEQTERVYRYLTEEMKPDSRPWILMTEGFWGVAFRFRAMTDYQSDFESSFFAPGGKAPPAEEQCRQERTLFGFFNTGLASLESFAFAVYAIGAHYKPNQFGISDTELGNVDPARVAAVLKESWPNNPLSTAMQRLVQDDVFKVWKEVRNILSHRVVPVRRVEFIVGQEPRSTWLFSKGKHSSSAPDESLDAVLGARRPWLAATLASLWDGLEQGFPPR